MQTKPSLVVIALAGALCASTAASAQDAQAPQPAPAAIYVIPPGQDALLADMFGGPSLFPGLCRLARATAAQTHVEIEYRCQGSSAPVILDARHPTGVGAGSHVVRTTQFALLPRAPGVTPPGLIDAVAERVRVHEAEWRWVTLQGAAHAPPPLGDASPGGEDGRADAAASPPTASSRQGLTPAQDQRYQQGLAHYRERRYAQAIDAYVSLARENPCCGVLGMVVASLASTAPAPGLAARYAAEADAAPDDRLKQFIAGTVAHYAAHHSGRSIEEKSRLYAQTIRYLERTRPAYDFEPRLFIYLAVSHFRLGHQREAEAFIERAVTLGRDDPDAFYCRAEIFQRANIQRSIADIDAYLRMMAVFERQGAVSDPAKTARVNAMREHLVAVSRGQASPTEIFDPLAVEAASEAPATSSAATRTRGPRRPARGVGESRRYGLRVLGVGAAIGGLWGLSRLLRKGSGAAARGTKNAPPSGK